MIGLPALIKRTPAIFHNAACYFRPLQYNYTAANSDLHLGFALSAPVKCHPSWHNGLELFLRLLYKFLFYFGTMLAAILLSCSNFNFPINSFVRMINLVLRQVVTDTSDQAALHKNIWLSRHVLRHFEIFH
jgi:hypothetical protein